MFLDETKKIMLEKAKIFREQNPGKLFYSLPVFEYVENPEFIITDFPDTFCDSLNVYGDDAYRQQLLKRFDNGKFLEENFRLIYKHLMITKDGYLRTKEEVCYTDRIINLSIGPLQVIRALFNYNLNITQVELPVRIYDNLQLLPDNIRQLYFFFKKAQQFGVNFKLFLQKKDKLIKETIRFVCSEEVPDSHRKEILYLLCSKTKIDLIEVNDTWLSTEKELDQILVPVWLVTLATYLKDYFGDIIDLRVKDMVADFESDKEFREYIFKRKPDICGLRSIHLFRVRLKKTIDIINGTGAKIIVGGPISNEYLEVPAISSETGLRDFIISHLSGLDFRSNDSFRINDLPIPRYIEFTDLKKYKRFMSYAYNQRLQGNLITSRGCNYMCRFCHNKTKAEFRSAENVFDEIRSLYELGVRDFYILDDIFNLDRERMKKICNRIIDSGININIYCANGLRGDILSEEEIDLLIQAGVVWITVAIENPSERLQRLINKNLDIKKIRENIQYMGTKNIILNYCFMIGLPEETKEEAYQILEFLKNLPPFLVPMLFTFKNFPGTGYYTGIDDLNSETPYHNFRHVKKDYIYDIYRKYYDNFFYNENNLRINIRTLRRIGFSKKETRDLYTLLAKKEEIIDLINEIY